MKTIHESLLLASIVAAVACQSGSAFGQTTMPSQTKDADAAAVAKNKATYDQALIPDLVADPSVVEFDGTFYCYATTDGEGKHLSTSGLPVVWTSKDFLNWSFKGSIFPPGFDGKYWAPSSPVRRDGTYYLYATINERLTVTTAQSPEGPFLNPETNQPGWKVIKPKVGGSIDAEVLLDDDGQAYMVWQHRGLGKMRPDLLDLQEAGQTLFPAKRNGYAEGQFVFKRNGIYYLLYTQGGDETYSYAYMYSRTGMNGPWIAPGQDLIAVTDRSKLIYGPGHGSFFHPNDSDQWYFVYLEYGRGSTNRQIYADKMNFNADGTIRPITVTKEGVNALRPAAGPVRPNLASNATASASSVRPTDKIEQRKDKTLDRVETFLPGSAVDGSNGTRWMAAAGDEKPSLQVDLGETRDVSGTEAYFVQPTHGHAYKIEHSVDGANWLPYGGHDDVRVQSPHVDDNTARARYLRLTILRGTPGLWEFRVYGK